MKDRSTEPESEGGMSYGEIPTVPQNEMDRE